MRVRLTRTDLLVLCVVVIWAAAFSAIKYALREISPLAFTSVRFLGAAVLLLVWVWMVEGRPVIRREDWLWMVLVGLTAVGVYQIFFTFALHYTTASNTSLLIGTAPIWTAIIAAASRQERITPVQIAGILLSFAGLALVIMAGNGSLALTWENLRGDVLAIIASVLTASSAVISKRPLQRYSSLRVMSVSMVCGSLFILPFAGREIVAQDWAQVPLSAWLALGYSIVFAGVIGYVFWYRSIGEIGATRTMIYNTLIPPTAVLIAVVTLGEKFTLLQALGAVVILAGVALTRFAPTKEGESQPHAQAEGSAIDAEQEA
jgi:drug/metabolite transporter (DMT)-like permease